jgi:type II secretory pathway component GspD/PulD (secretin)
MIMVTAPIPILQACEKAIKELDVEIPQVYVEARFVELENNVQRDLGIDWSMLDGMRGSVQLGGGLKSRRLGRGITDYKMPAEDSTGTYTVSGKDGDITYFNGTLNFNELYLVLHALEANEDAKIFSNPKIIVTSGKKATVDMTTKYPNVKISAKRTVTGTDNTSVDLDMQMADIPGEDKMMFAKESFFSWGISLEVIPRISTNGLINVSIVPTISDQVDWVSAGTQGKEESETISSKYPVIGVQRLITQFNMASGSTAVIGGLSRTVEEQRDSGIPYLSKIPWIGDVLFGGKQRHKTQKEIIVFVTVGLVDPRRMSKDAGLPKNAVLGRQYTEGKKLEPGDMPDEFLQGQNSIDTRSLEEQARQPIKSMPDGDDSTMFIPFINNKEK